MPDPRWYYREAVVHELDRLGAQTWMYQDDQAQFRDRQQAGPADVELSSDVFGAVLWPADRVLKALQQLHDGAGDNRIAEVLFGHRPSDC